jgi:hypothetical protein
MQIWGALRDCDHFTRLSCSSERSASCIPTLHRAAMRFMAPSSERDPPCRPSALSIACFGGAQDLCVRLTVPRSIHRRLQPPIVVQPRSEGGDRPSNPTLSMHFVTVAPLHDLVDGIATAPEAVWAPQVAPKHLPSCGAHRLLAEYFGYLLILPSLNPSPRLPIMGPKFMRLSVCLHCQAPCMYWDSDKKKSELFGFSSAACAAFWNHGSIPALRVASPCGEGCSV